MTPIRTTKTEDIYPATPALLKKYHINSPKYLEERNRVINLKTSNNIVDSKLRLYQNQAANFLLNPGSKACFDQQRLGKTPTVLTVLKQLNAKAIIVVPTSLLYQWNTEYKNWYNDNVVVIDGNKAKREQLYKLGKSIIISYKTLSLDIELISKLKFDVMVIDEAHRLRNLKKGTKYAPKEALAVIKMGKKVNKRIALSGTPAPNYKNDIYGILAFLFPDIFTSYWNFSEYYFKTEEVYIARNKKVRNVLDEFKEGKEKELLEFLDLISIQRKRKEVMQWLPEYNIHKIILPMNNEQKKAHKSLEEIYEYEDILCLNKLDKMTMQRMITVYPPAVSSNLNSDGCKVDFIRNYIEDYPEKSIIIVTNFNQVLRFLYEILPNSAIINGSTKPKSRDEIKSKFQSKKLKIILANIQVIKEGFQLDTADTIIFLDSSLTYTDNVQCMDRLVPVSKDRVHETSQDILLLLAEDSIDMYLYDMVYVKKKDSSDIINDYLKYLERK